ncbi:histidine kinase dimerization/phospho-acceptor domain-containing protein [Gloeobacter kilaueensis]|uniref:histidine kinase n=1 Tax=Gloeobacter kilaueensis (strain ATCC BAA-2537 / CCAP 1431/1 / ULC 316 / JS1) TaxID=1183438 RepID=U5QQS6_GLOK1|nr:histidine kinase dimerization/phospho-acceptor domain-containing protein [Gloeobacter kilaueensis]AGY59979.1 hypothetical protein GKIL_3733 [Gloeobacter kilaueensis JS1]
MLKTAVKSASTRDLRHDIGEPLLAIRLYAQVLRSGDALDPRLSETLLEAIEEQAVTLQRRLEEVLGDALSNPYR